MTYSTGPKHYSIFFCVITQPKIPSLKRWTNWNISSRKKTKRRSLRFQTTQPIYFQVEDDKIKLYLKAFLPSVKNILQGFLNETPWSELTIEHIVQFSREAGDCSHLPWNSSHYHTLTRPIPLMAVHTFVPPTIHPIVKPTNISHLHV